MTNPIPPSNRTQPSNSAFQRTEPLLPAPLNASRAQHPGQQMMMQFMVTGALARRERIEQVRRVALAPQYPLTPVPYNIFHMLTHTNDPVGPFLPAAAQGPAQAKRPAPDSLPENDVKFEISTPASYEAAERLKAEKRKKVASDKVALLESNDRIHTADQHIQQQQIHEAVQAIRQAYSFVSGQGFVHRLLSGLDKAMHHCYAPWVFSTNEGDIDLLMLRGIYTIKHKNYQEAKRLLQVVLAQDPNERIARLLYDFADELSQRPLIQPISFDTNSVAELS